MPWGTRHRCRFPRAVRSTLEDQDELILCLGSDFAHKNRAVRAGGGAASSSSARWPGRLVLAGPHVRYGSSREDEQRLLDGSPRLAGAVLTLEAVTAADKEWLLARRASSSTRRCTRALA